MISSTTHALHTPEAALMLSQALGLTAEVWSYRLANWRKPGRRAVIPHHSDPDGSPLYLTTDLDNFINGQLDKRKLMSEGAPAEQPRAGAMPVFDDTERPHIRVLFATGSVTQSVFAIDAAMARRLARNLLASADALEKHAPIVGVDSIAEGAQGLV